jgi:GTPase Era involved in 16S rRNA processing
MKRGRNLMLNKWARIEELRLQEENPFEYKLMQKNGTLDNYLEKYGKDAAEQAANIYRSLDKKMVFLDEDKLTENQRRNRISEMTREFMMYD